MTEPPIRSPLMPRVPQPWREIIVLCGVALTYALIARLGLVFVAQPEQVAAIWPVSGFALGILLLRDRRHWPGTLGAIFIANVLSNLSGGNPVWVSFGFATANTLEPLLGAWMLRTYYPRVLGFWHPRDVVALVGAAVISVGIAGAIGAAVPALAFDAPYVQTWWLWCVSDGLGILLVTPLIMTWVTRPDRSELTPARLLEAGFLAALLTVGTWYVFGPLTSADGATVRPYVLYPLLVWLALRFSPRGVASVLFLVSAIAAWGTVSDGGAFAFAQQTLTQHIVTLQIFLGVTAVTILILSAVVTENRHALAAVQRQTEELDGFFNVNLDLLCIADTQGTFRRLNPEWEKALGYPLAELIDQRFLDFVHPDDVAATQRALSRLLAQQPVFDFVNRYRCRDGRWRWLEWRAHPMGDLIYAAARDITEHQETEHRLRESETSLKRSQEVAHVGHWMWDTQTNHVFWSDEMQRIFGLDPTTFDGDLAQIIATAIHPDDREKVNRSNEAVLTEQRPAPLEYRVVWPDHSVHTVWAVPGDAVRDDHGQIVKLMGIVQDITERKQAEEKLRRSEERYAKFITQSFEGIYRTEFDHPIDTTLPVEEQIDAIYANAYMAECNQALVAMYRLPSVEAFIGARLIDVHGGKDNPVNRAAFRKFIANGYVSINDETLELDADGQPVWFLSNTIGTVENDCLVRLWGTALVITERKQAEEKLRQSEEQYRNLIHFLPAGVIVHRAGRVLLANRTSARVFGADSPEQLVGCPLLDLVHPDFRDVVRTRVGQALQQGDIAELMEEKLLRLDGETLYAEVVALPITFDGLPAMLAMFNDVTARRQAQEQREAALVALLDSEARYRALFEASPIAIWEQDFSAVQARFVQLRQSGVVDLGAYLEDHPAEVLDLAGRVSLIEMNQASIELLGGETRADIFTDLRRYFGPEALHVFVRELRALAAGQTHFASEIPVFNIRGENIWLNLSLTVRPGHEATLGRVLVSFNNITARKRAEAQEAAALMALQDSEAQYRLLAENMSDTIWLMDLDLRPLYASPSVYRLRGYTLEELNELPLQAQMPPDSYRRVMALLTEVLSPENLRQPPSRLTYSLELEFYRKDGSKFWSENTFTLICNAAGLPTHTLVSGRDITDRKRRERELEAIVETAMALRAAPTYAETLPVIVHKIYDLLKAESAALMMREAATGEAVIIYGQGQWANWLGRRIPPGEGVTGYVLTTRRQYVSDDARQDARLYWPEFVGHLASVACVPLIAHDQAIGALWAGRNASIQPDEVSLLQAIADMAANALQRAQIVETLEQRVADRTRELEAANARLKELDQLKSKFVSDVSHELRTPVTSLRLCVDLLERGRPEKRDQYLKVIRQQTDRQAQLVEDILNLSRLELGAAKVEFRPVDLNDLIAQAVEAHQPTAETAGLQLRCRVATNLPLVRGEPNQLGQVVNNLIANAIHYTPTGEVEVRTGMADDGVYLEVSDTGLGIAPEDLPHVFDRFYRGSRTSGIRGTGLGLAIVKEIVDLHDGRVEVASVAGVGSTFHVHLPRLNTK